MTIRVAGVEVAVAQAVYKNDQFKEFYIGGAPQELRERCWPVYSLIFFFFFISHEPRG